jgi:hypothetical protein
MWRFYAIATIIVVAIGSVVFAHRLVTRDWNVTAPPNPHQTPTVTRGNGDAQARAWAKFSGEGPWVMSALPSCFEQQSSKSGPAELLADDVPPASERLRPTTLRRGACTVIVREHDILVFRSDDRLRVPPEAHLYRHGDSLTLVWKHAGRMEIRVY